MKKKAVVYTNNFNPNIRKFYIYLFIFINDYNSVIKKSETIKMIETFLITSNIIVKSLLKIVLLNSFD